MLQINFNLLLINGEKDENGCIIATTLVGSGLNGPQDGNILSNSSRF